MLEYCLWALVKSDIKSNTSTRDINELQVEWMGFLQELLSSMT
jgi:hypothetical protein